MTRNSSDAATTTAAGRRGTIGATPVHGTAPVVDPTGTTLQPTRFGAATIAALAEWTAANQRAIDVYHDATDCHGGIKRSRGCCERCRTT